ncbi:MAG TPA: ABC transporter ATP-binding protein [Polyangia bacterium]|jgi:ATP-binding cassette subfamily B protein
MRTLPAPPAAPPAGTPIRRVTVRRLLGLFRPYWRSAILVILAVVVVAVLGLANPLLVRAIIDKAIARGDRGLLLLLCGAMIGVTLVIGAVDTAETWMTTRMGQRVMFDLRDRLYRHLQRLSLRFFTETRTGEVLSRITADVTGVQEVVTATLSQTLSDTVAVATTVALMFALDWKLTLICLAMLPLFVWPTRIASRVRRRLSREAQAKVADLAAHLDETLSVSGVLLTKTFGRQAREIGRFGALGGDLMRLEVRRAMISQLFWVTLQAFWAVAPALIYLVGGRAVTAGTMTLGGVVAFVALQNRLFFPLGHLFSVQVQIQGALALFDRIFDYLDLPVEVDDRPGAAPLQVGRGEVSFDEVHFGYTTAREVLRGVSFTAQPGTLTALVGPSGAGKTTITYLLPRLFDVGGGAVRLDGQDVRDVTLASVGAAVGVVTQETFLFHATIRENLCYGRPDATEAEMIEAARAAQIHEHVMALPDGYDTVVGERGYKLSGGERQRVAIARVLLKNSPVVILDEATSALDTAHERLIQRALEPLFAGRTTIAIAHRLSTVLRADQILVLDAGRIVERGTHLELYRRGGLYRQLVDAQFSGVEELPGADTAAG